MKKSFLLFPCFLLLLMLTAFQSVAQNIKEKKIKIDSIPLKGYIYDRLTTKDVISTKVHILRPDSTLISTAKGGYRYYDYKNNQVKEDSTSYYEIYLPRLSGEYIIKVSKDGYEDLYVPYTAEIGKRASELNAPKLYMSRKTVRQLEELTVKASKIKFYHKGDTLVYNPEAFILTEG